MAMQHRVLLKSWSTRSLSHDCQLILAEKCENRLLLWKHSRTHPRYCGRFNHPSVNHRLISKYNKNIKLMQVSSGGLIVDDDNGLRIFLCDGKAMTHFHISLLSSAAVQLNLNYVFVNLKLWVFSISDDKASIADARKMRVFSWRGK